MKCLMKSSGSNFTDSTERPHPNMSRTIRIHFADLSQGTGPYIQPMTLGSGKRKRRAVTLRPFKRRHTETLLPFQEHRSIHITNGLHGPIHKHWPINETIADLGN